MRASYIVAALLAFASPALAQVSEFIVENVESSNWYKISPNEISIREYRASSPPRIRFSQSESVSKCVLYNVSCDSKEPITLKIPVTPIKPRLLTLKYRRSGRERQIRIRILDSVSNDFTIKGRSVLNKSILVAPWRYLMSISPRGELIYYNASFDKVVDFKQHLIDGKIFYSYMRTLFINPSVNSEGERIVIDEKFRVVEKFLDPSDVHEFVYLGKGHIIRSYYGQTKTAAGECYIDQAFEEVKQKKLVEKFSVADFFKIGYVPDPPDKVSYQGKICISDEHLNAIQIIDPERWLISLGRSTVIMWNKSLKKAEWILGGPNDQFRLQKHQQANLLHTPVWTPQQSRLVLLDNNHTSTKTRILDYQLNIDKKSVISFKEIELGNGFSKFGGSLQVDNDNVFSVGTGMREKNRWDFIELQKDKQTMSIRFGKDNEFTGYRVYRGVIR